MFHRGIDGTDPIRFDAVMRRARARHEHRLARSWRLGSGTLACPRCDAPVLPSASRVTPADPLDCPYCSHGGFVRDFLSLGEPTRPTRVELRVVQSERRLVQ